MSRLLMERDEGCHFQGLHGTIDREFSLELSPGKGGSCPTWDSSNGNSPKGKGNEF